MWEFVPSLPKLILILRAFYFVNLDLCSSREFSAMLLESVPQRI